MQKENKPRSLNPDLGQHIMTDPVPLNKISKNVPENSTVIEIGAGTGLLTMALAEKVRRVVAIEIDEQFKPDLVKVKQKHRNVEIVQGNALSGITEQIIQKESHYNRPIYIVSNLPYNITEPFVIKAGSWGRKMILTVGKKFSYQALMQDPSDERFAALAFVTRSFFEVQKIADVQRSSFSPPPATESAILFFDPKKKPLSLADFIGQFLIKGQKHGGLVKSGLREGFISFLKSLKKETTKNEARVIVNKLNLNEELLNKSFAQLKSEEVRLLALALDGLNLK